MARSTYNNPNIVSLIVRDEKGKIVAAYDMAPTGIIYNTTNIFAKGKDPNPSNIFASGMSWEELDTFYGRGGYKKSFRVQKDISEYHKRKLKPTRLF